MESGNTRHSALGRYKKNWRPLLTARKPNPVEKSVTLSACRCAAASQSPLCLCLERRDGWRRHNFGEKLQRPLHAAQLSTAGASGRWPSEAAANTERLRWRALRMVHEPEGIRRNRVGEMTALGPDSRFGTQHGTGVQDATGSTAAAFWTSVSNSWPSRSAILRNQLNPARLQLPQPALVEAEQPEEFLEFAESFFACGTDCAVFPSLVS